MLKFKNSLNRLFQFQPQILEYNAVFADLLYPKAINVSNMNIKCEHCAGSCYASFWFLLQAIEEEGTAMQARVVR